MKHFYFLLVFGSLLSCNNIEDAPTESRNTFIRFYEKGGNYTGQAAEILEDGYLIAGNIHDGNIYSAVITKVDFNGNTIGEIALENTTVSNIKSTSNGYLIWSDSINIDPNANNVNDQIITRAHLIKMDIELKRRLDHNLIFDPENLRTDFHGNSLTFDGQGNIISTGSFKSGNNPGIAFVAAFNPSTLDTLWTQFYSLQDRDFSNSKSVFVNAAGNIIWAGSALQEQQSSAQSYLTVPFVAPNSTYINNALFGKNADLFYSGEDIQLSRTGYSVIGTFSGIQKTNQNIFFVQFDLAGNLVPGSERYFDALGQDGSIMVEANISKTEDTGSALAPTNDGGFLLGGSLTSTPEIGNGGKDIFLIRLDAFGNVLWNKNIGGAGDETVSSIRVTKDNGFLICGSSSVNGLSSLTLIKLDKNGNINN
jgi:hypothetical protein